MGKLLAIRVCCKLSTHQRTFDHFVHKIFIHPLIRQQTTHTRMCSGCKIRVYKTVASVCVCVCVYVRVCVRTCACALKVSLQSSVCHSHTCTYIHNNNM